MNSSGAVTGPYLDSNRVAHGYLRAANGAVTSFDAPDAGTGPAQGSGDTPAQALRFKNEGTIPIAINSAGVIAGTYVDNDLGYHGFVRTANGALTEFDVPASFSCSDSYEGGTRPLAVNASGVIAGTFLDCSIITFEASYGPRTGQLRSLTLLALTQIPPTMAVRFPLESTQRETW